MTFVDRISKYPGRWTMKKSDGTSEVVTLVRNDEPIVEGTPLNAEALNSIDMPGLQSNLSLAIFQAEAATASLSDKTDSLLDWMERMTEVEQFSLSAVSGDLLETASGETLEVGLRVVRTAKTLDDAEYLPVSLGLLKQCMDGGGLNQTSAVLGKAVLGRMQLGTT